MNEARTIAVTFEDEIFRGAVDQTDYFRKISLKMVTMETKWQHAAGSSTSSLSIHEASKKPPLNPGHLMDNDDSKPSLSRAEPAFATGDLTTQLSSDSRQNNVNKTSVQYMTRPSPQIRESSMNKCDWRTELKPDSREKVVNEITEALKKHLPFSSPEEIRRIAARFEEKIFSSAVNQTGYFRTISLKMLTMETKYQNAAGSSSSSTSLPITGAYNSLPLNPGYLMDNNNVTSSLPKGEPDMDTDDWRTHLPPESREEVINKILETLKKHLPYSGQEGINELRRIASRFEDKVCSGAVNQTDYLRKITTKMLIMESKSPNAAGSSSSSLPMPGAYNSLPLNPDIGYHQMTMEGPVKAEPAVNTGDWRTCLPPDFTQEECQQNKGNTKETCSKLWERRK